MDLWPKRNWAYHKSEHEKPGAVTTYSMNQENEGSKIFIISLSSNSGERFQLKQTYVHRGLYSEIQPAKLINRSTHINCEIPDIIR